MFDLVEWRRVVGYEDSYAVSSEGAVVSITRVTEIDSSRSPNPIYRKSVGKLKVVVKDKDGYIKVHLYKDGTDKLCFVHRLVAQAFHPNPDDKATVNHINEVKDDNSVENLEWMTQAENVRHSLTKTKEARWG